MTSNGTRLSAVARRRLQQVRSGSSTPVGPSAAPELEKSQTQSPSRDLTSNSLQKTDDVKPTEEAISQNQFTPLVEASAVHFSSTREIEQVNKASIKIKLSRSQKCFVLGICDLWVKNGSILVYGTTIRASPAVYRIYAPSSHALPSIEACEKQTEFQLDSVGIGLGELPYVGTRNIWAPPGVEQSALTFYVLGHTFDHDAKAPKRFKELNIDPWKSFLGPLDRGGSNPASVPPRLLLCGRRSSGLSTFFRCYVNHVLETSAGGPGRSNRRPQQVTVLDLDSTMPEFSPPGTISLVHLRTPILGPALTHMLPTQGTSSRILKLHFVGDVEAANVSESQIECILDLLEVEKHARDNLGGAIMVILAPKWLNETDAVTAGKLWAKMAPTEVVCLDNNTTSPHLRPWRSLAEAADCSIRFLPVQTFDKLPLLREHDLQMQSYFHSKATRAGRMWWDDRPILADTGAQITLTYRGRHAQVKAIALVGGYVGLEDTYDALEGSVVAIVAVKARRSHQSDSEQNHVQDLESGSLDAEDRDILPGVARTEEGLPRLMTGEEGYGVPAKRSECMGFGLVTRIDIAQQQIRLQAGGTLQVIIQERMQGQQVVLVLQKATSDGRYKPDWARREIEKPGKEMLDSQGTIGAELR
ncbi:hypothetical protein LTR84_007631 [Exophiala bonariae]|uniref:Polynucleotide 5'-hydroxyl-kinase GRC3 n=1 Tax=Exophiala bonariae TaxID=1690606 RepID=A0AAV9NKQ4_9EURO|nr:hypothetical protein LTR84_007631 [Exophiala bonariae]